MELNTITYNNGSKIFFSFKKNSKILGRTLTPSNIFAGKSVDNDLHFGKPNTFIYKKIIDELCIKDDSAFFDFTINGVKSVVEFSISDQGHVQFNIKEMKALFQSYSKGEEIVVKEIAIILDFNNRIINLMKISNISMMYPYDSRRFQRTYSRIIVR